MEPRRIIAAEPRRRPRSRPVDTALRDLRLARRDAGLPKREHRRGPFREASRLALGPALAVEGDRNDCRGEQRMIVEQTPQSEAPESGGRFRHGAEIDAATGAEQVLGEPMAEAVIADRCPARSMD